MRSIFFSHLVSHHMHPGDSNSARQLLVCGVGAEWSTGVGKWSGCRGEYWGWYVERVQRGVLGLVCGAGAEGSTGVSMWSRCRGEYWGWYVEQVQRGVLGLVCGAGAEGSTGIGMWSGYRGQYWEGINKNQVLHKSSFSRATAK